MRADGAGPAPHEDRAFIDRVAVPVVERDRSTLFVGQPLDNSSFGASGGQPLERRWRRRLMQWLTQTRVSHEAGRSIRATESQDRQALSCVS